MDREGNDVGEHTTTTTTTTRGSEVGRDTLRNAKRGPFVGSSSQTHRPDGTDRKPGVAPPKIESESKKTAAKKTNPKLKTRGQHMHQEFCGCLWCVCAFSGGREGNGAAKKIQNCYKPSRFVWKTSVRLKGRQSEEKLAKTT